MNQGVSGQPDRERPRGRGVTSECSSVQPLPSPSSSRPPDTMSSVAAMLAGTAGWRWWMPVTIVASQVVLCGEALKAIRMHLRGVTLAMNVRICRPVGTLAATEPADGRGGADA